MLKSEGILACYAALISSQQPESVLQQVLDYVTHISALEKKWIPTLLEEGFYSSILSYLKGNHTFSRSKCLDLFKLFVSTFLWVFLIFNSPDECAEQLQSQGLLEILIGAWKNVGQYDFSRIALQLIVAHIGIVCSPTFDAHKQDKWKAKDLAILIKHNAAEFIIQRMAKEIGPTQHEEELEGLIMWLHRMISPPVIYWQR